MSSEVTLKEQRDYAWSYFQLHANQRMTSFNFFVVIAALLTAGLARSLENDFKYYLVGLCLGISLMITSFIFGSLISECGTSLNTPSRH
jgi:hypothetical protein